MACARIVLCGTLAGCVMAPAYEECAVRCGSGDACPEGLTCLGDLFCHHSSLEPLCGGDAGVDGAVPAVDAGQDGVMSMRDAPEPDAPTACVPKGGDTLCAECMKERCCDPLSLCLDDATCACYVECFLKTGETIGCAPVCGTPNSLVTNLDACRQENCSGECSS